MLYLKRKVMEKHSVFYDGTGRAWVNVQALLTRYQKQYPRSIAVMIFGVPCDTIPNDTTQITAEQRARLVDCYFSVWVECSYIIGKFTHKSLFKENKGDTLVYNLAEGENL